VHNHIQDKAKDPRVLSRIEKDNKNKDIDYWAVPHLTDMNF